MNAAPSDRWRPTRAGLVSVWRYWDEVFTFHRGRLLLRGPNGSGKSLALELLLPFLFDADTTPWRLTSATKSRGGLYDRVMTGSDEASRTGFAWVEFRRGPEAFTVGARMRASQATRRAEVDYFTTTLTVGDGLHLLDEHRVPLSRPALAEAIGDTGAVHHTGEHHRAAVRATLFPGFGADRYASVIGALLTLRKEKLSQQLVNADELSDLLSASLPPLDEQDIAEVAEGFERLDRRRAEIDALAADLDAVRQLDRRQRGYARAVVVAAARGVVSAETRRDDVTRREREARVDVDAVTAEAAAADDDLRATDSRLTDIDVEIEARKDSDAYRSGAALTDLRRQGRQLAAAAERARAAAEGALTSATTASEERVRAAAEAATTAGTLDRAARDLHSAAQPVGADAAAAEAGAAADGEDGERFLLAWTADRRARVAKVRDALATHGRAVDRRQLHEQQVEEAEKWLAERADARDAARADLAGATARYGDDVGHWASACAVVGPDRLLAAMPRPPEEPDAVERAVAGVRSEVERELAVARSELGRESGAAEAERADLLDRRARWERSALPEVEPPTWRSAREGTAGAPLWALVDPRSDATPEDVDRLEAALTAAGLLDAWVQPSGAVTLLDGRSDLVLTASTRSAPAGTLLELLDPVPDAAVGGAVVGAVLAGVPLVDTALPPAAAAEMPVGGNPSAAAPTWAPKGGEGTPAAPAGVAFTGIALPPPLAPGVAVGRDGTFRLGTAAGRGPDRPASVLGAPARERHRRLRLAELDRLLVAVGERLDDVARRADDLDRRAAAARSELDAAPDGAPVRQAARSAETATVRLDDARSGVDGARQALRRAEDEVRTTLRSLTSLSTQNGLPAEAAALNSLEAQLGALEAAAGTWARRTREAARAATELRRAEQRAIEADALAASAEAGHAAAEAEAAETAGRVAALDASVGADYRHVLDRIEALGAERSKGRARVEELRRRTPQLHRRLGQLAQALEDAGAARQRAEDVRESARRQLVAVTDDLLPDTGFAAPDTLEGVSAVLGFARSLLTDHGGVVTEPDVVERLSGRVNDQVHQAGSVLGVRVEVDRELTGSSLPADDATGAGGGAAPDPVRQWWVLRTVAGGVRRRAGELVESLAGELDRGQAELAEEEERLFEQTLAGSVRRALADRIRQANALVDAINLQLDAVRTAAAGVRVRLQWAVDPDQLDAVKAARALLLRDPADLTDGERASLQDFVRARVDQARAELGGNAPWTDRLRESLDYRAWHRFTLQIAHRDWEGYQPATPRRLQRLSTGERSMALHLPTIASIAAHYAGEDGRPSGCPRLILLDELFAGVDTANRAQLFGTFSAWDLDAVFTSDHEWCQYATLDGIAIHHLHPGGPDEPVTSTRFTWDGHTRRVDPGAPAA